MKVSAEPVLFKGSFWASRMVACVPTEQGRESNPLGFFIRALILYTIHEGETF